MRTVAEHMAAVRRTLVRTLPDPVVGFLRRVLRRVRPVSMVSREPRLVVWVRRHILRRRPVLYHFEIHVTDHCNLNCRGCTHFSNLCKPSFADIVEFEKDMRAMARVFSHVHQIYLLGGEPLLHPEVDAFVRVARDAFPRTKLFLMTNGTLVTRMSEAFWTALAETKTVLLCDSYPIGLPVEEIEQLGREHGVTVEWTVQREEFFKIPIDTAGGHDRGRSFRGCEGFNNCPIVRDGRLYPCAFIAYADALRDYFGIDELEPVDTDSIGIRDEADPEKVMRFLRNPVPWCANCDMENRAFYPWGRSERKPEEWLKVP